MKKEMPAFTALFICAVLLFSTASVRAGAVSTSTAQIDWTSLIISGDITWGDKGSESYAYVEDATDSDEDSQAKPGWVDTSAYASVYHAYGAADTNGDSLYEEVYAIANNSVTTWASAEEVYAWRWGYFTANSDGMVEFSADYELWQKLLTGGVDEGAYGYAEAGLYLENDDTSGWDEDLPSLENEVWDGDSITDSDAGTLSVAVWFDEGDEGYFEAWVYNDADVEIPEPATMALLTLGGLAMLRRRNRFSTNAKSR